MLIVFDLDDTLIDTSGAITPFKLKQIVERIAADRPLPQTALAEMVALNQGCQTTKEAIRLTLDRYDAWHLHDEILDLYTAPLPPSFAVPTTPHAKKVLQVLLAKKYILALVTGGKRAFQLQKLEKAGLEPSIFSKIAVPEDSLKRPYYEDLLREFSIAADDAFVVGDRISMDLAPARELGIKTVQMRWGRGLIGKQEQWIDYTIRELSELLEIV